jgi:predicted GIY-YIG superfamily endonuclease
MPFWVYILSCSDGSYYTGHTDDLEIRLFQHQSGEVEGCYTHSRRPVKLIVYQEFPTRDEAFAAEIQIKGWSRAKKEAMIKGDWEEVSRLARSKKRNDFSLREISSSFQTTFPCKSTPRSSLAIALRQAQGER